MKVNGQLFVCEYCGEKLGEPVPLCKECRDWLNDILCVMVPKDDLDKPTEN
jgi:hypothetical protein